MRRAAIYVRVSTEEQSLENQLTMLREYEVEAPEPHEEKEG